MPDDLPHILAQLAAFPGKLKERLAQVLQPVIDKMFAEVKEDTSQKFLSIRSYLFGDGPGKESGLWPDDTRGRFSTLEPPLIGNERRLVQLKEGFAGVGRLQQQAKRHLDAERRHRAMAQEVSDRDRLRVMERELRRQVAANKTFRSFLEKQTGRPLTAADYARHAVDLLRKLDIQNEQSAAQRGIHRVAHEEQAGMSVVNTNTFDHSPHPSHYLHELLTPKVVTTADTVTAQVGYPESVQEDENLRYIRYVMTGTRPQGGRRHRPGLQARPFLGELLDRHREELYTAVQGALATMLRRG